MWRLWNSDYLLVGFCCRSVACSLSHVFNVEFISYFDELYCQRIHWHWQLADILMIVLNIISKRKWWHLHFQTPLTRLQNFKFVFWSSSSPSRQFNLELWSSRVYGLTRPCGPWIHDQNKKVPVKARSWFIHAKNELWKHKTWTWKLLMVNIFYDKHEDGSKPRFNWCLTAVYHDDSSLLLLFITSRSTALPEIYILTAVIIVVIMLVLLVFLDGGGVTLKIRKSESGNGIF